MIKILILLFLGFFTFLHSATQNEYENCSCSSSWISETFEITNSSSNYSGNSIPSDYKDFIYNCSGNDSKTEISHNFKHTLVTDWGDGSFTYRQSDEITFSSFTCGSCPVDKSYFIDITSSCSATPPCGEGMDRLNDICQCKEGFEPNGSNSCVEPSPCSEGYSDIYGVCVADNPDDIDGDGVSNNEDPDIDGDGVPNWEDPDIDGDGVPNNDDSSSGGNGGGDNASCLRGAVYSYNAEACVCLNGTSYSSFDGCQVSECLIDYNGKTLRNQGGSSSQCMAAYPSYLGYDTEFISDGSLSCCYATESHNSPPQCAPSQFRNSSGICEDIPSQSPECNEFEYLDEYNRCSPIPCPEGQLRDSNGECSQYLPPSESCLVGYRWNNVTQQCERVSNSGGGDGSGNGNGSGNGGGVGGGVGNGEEATNDVVLNFDNLDVDQINGDFSAGVGEQFTNLLDSTAGDMTTLFSITVPVSASCGCENPSIDYKGFHQEVNLCSPLDTILGYMRPVLWFSLLLGILLGYFRGGNT